MRAFLAIYCEAFAWLRRDKVFIPVLLAGFVISLFASAISQWSMEDFQKILFDVGLAGFRLTGGAVAMLWGTRLIHDALAERSLDPRLAAPISRSTWFLARYFALATVLVLMGLVFAIWWQGILYFNGFGIMTNIQGWALGLLSLEWLVIAALAMMIATFTGFGLALFSVATLWLIGLLAPLIAVAVKDPSVSASQSIVVDWIGDLWNFQRFNLIDQVRMDGQTIQLPDLTMRLSWAFSLLVALLTGAMWRFSERDLG